MGIVPPYALEIAVVALGLVLLAVESFAGPGFNKRWLARIAVAGLIVVLIATWFTSGAPEGATADGAKGFWTFYAADGLALFFKRFALVTTIFVLMMMLDFSPVVAKFLPQASPQGGIGEFFCLPLFTCAGLMWMASAQDLVSIFVSLELVTISFYVLVTYMRRNAGSLEAGVKYLILGALSTGFLVYGITWIIGVTGEMNLARMGPAVAAVAPGNQGALLFGLALIIVALGFKVAAFPLQIWVPDVYQGAPMPVTAYLSVGSKAAGFVVLMRVIDPFLQSAEFGGRIIQLLLILAAATMLFGNLAAIPQTNLKRLLAYSSIAHAGFLLLGVASVVTAPGGSTSITSPQAVGFYLAAYLFMTLLSFMVLGIVRLRLGSDSIDTFNGLSRRSPFLAGAMLVAMASLAGIPFTAGFLGKFFIILLGIERGMAGNSWFFVVLCLALIGIGAGFYYYFKVIRAMFWNPPESEDPIDVPIVARAGIWILVAAIFIFGVYPAPILRLLGS